MSSYTLRDFTPEGPIAGHYQNSLFWMPMGLGGNNNIVDQATENTAVGVKTFLPGSTSSNPTRCWVPGAGMSLYVLAGGAWTGTVHFEGRDQFAKETREDLIYSAETFKRTANVYSSLTLCRIDVSLSTETLQVSTRTATTSAQLARHGLPFRLRDPADFTGVFFTQGNTIMTTGAIYYPADSSVSFPDHSLTAAGQLVYLAFRPGAILVAA